MDSESNNKTIQTSKNGGKDDGAVVELNAVLTANTWPSASSWKGNMLDDRMVEIVKELEWNAIVPDFTHQQEPDMQLRQEYQIGA